MNTRTTLSAVVLLALSLPLSASGQHPLLIIAPSEFIPELEPLKSFKEASARPTFLLSLEQVYEYFPIGVDEAEQVKVCIAYYEQNYGVQAVLLFGDIDKLPARYTWWGELRLQADPNDPNAVLDPNDPNDIMHDHRGWGATDLYYADLYKNGDPNFFDTWDANGNGLYGEVQFHDPNVCDDPNYGWMINQDVIDFLPDVSVGRIPASTLAEVQAYRDKVIAYELKTQPTDEWFRNVALYTGTWLPNDDSTKDTIGAMFPAPPDGFTLIKRYHGTDTPDPSDIIGDINTGVGFVNYIGHGSRTGWEFGFDSTDLTSLSNSDEYPVVFAAACDTGMFAWPPRACPYVENDPNRTEHCGTLNGEALGMEACPPHASLPRPALVQDDGDDGQVACAGPFCTICEFDPDCIAEAFVFGNPPGPSGAIAYLGERSGGQVGSTDLDAFFFEAYTQGTTVLGDMWKYMIQEYYALHDVADSHNWVVPAAGYENWIIGHIFDEPRKFILFGDPSVVVGGAFTVNRGGVIWDWDPYYSGPWFSYVRYRIVSDVVVPYGEMLSAQPNASVLFEDERMLSVADGSYGFYAYGAAEEPVYFLSLGSGSEPESMVNKFEVRCVFQLLGGGQLKMY